VHRNQGANKNCQQNTAHHVKSYRIDIFLVGFSGRGRGGRISERDVGEKKKERKVKKCTTWKG